MFLSTPCCFISARLKVSCVPGLIGGDGAGGSLPEKRARRKKEREQRERESRGVVGGARRFSRVFSLRSQSSSQISDPELLHPKLLHPKRKTLSQCPPPSPPAPPCARSSRRCVRAKKGGLRRACAGAERGIELVSFSFSFLLPLQQRSRYLFCSFFTLPALPP